MIASNPNKPMEYPGRLTAQKLFILDEKLTKMRQLSSDEDFKITISDVPENVVLQRKINLYRGDELVEMKD